MPKAYQTPYPDHRKHLEIGVTRESILAFQRKQEKERAREKRSDEKYFANQNKKLEHLYLEGKDQVTYKLPGTRPPKGRQNYRHWRYSNTYEGSQIQPSSHFFLPEELR